MPTVKQFLEKIPDEKVRNRALKNLYKERELDQCVSISHAIFTAFLWHRSPELYSYWKAIHHNFNHPGEQMKVPAPGEKKSRV